MTTTQIDIPDGCPPSLAELLRHHNGDKQEVANILNLSKPHVQKLINGKIQLQDAIEERIKKLLTTSNGQANVLQSDVALPVVTRSVKKTFPDWARDADPLIIQLLEKFDYNRSAATRAIGRTDSSLIQKLATGERGFTAFYRTLIMAAIRGEPLPATAPVISDDLDKYTLGMAIVVATPADFERLYDLGEALDGKWLFKMQARGMWIAFLKASSDKLKVYKKVALRDAIAIVCP
jgi:plasmid maintenance system antidote protein VapI